MKCLLKAAAWLACGSLANAQAFFPIVMTNFCESSPSDYVFQMRNATNATTPEITIPMNDTTGKCLYPGRRETSGQYATFGNISSKHFLALYLPPENQSLGCGPVDRAPLWLEDSPSGFAVLLERGNCTFVEKTQHAISIGAKAVIFGNNPGQPTVSPGGGEALNLPITALMISWPEFDVLQRLASYRNYNATMSILVAETTVPSIFRMLMPVLIPTVLGTMAAGLAILLGIYGYIKFRQLGLVRMERERILEELSRNKEALSQLATKMYKKPSVDANPDAPDETFCSGCAICLEEFETGESVRELPCHHVYHTECIDPWLEKKASCPYCKYNIVSKRYEPINLKDGQPALASTANSERVGGDVDSTVTMETPREAGGESVIADPGEEESAIEIRSPTPKTVLPRTEPPTAQSPRLSETEVRSPNLNQIQSASPNPISPLSPRIANQASENGFTTVDLSVVSQSR